QDHYSYFNLWNRRLWTGFPRSWTNSTTQSTVMSGPGRQSCPLALLHPLQSYAILALLSVSKRCFAAVRESGCGAPLQSRMSAATADLGPSRKSANHRNPRVKSVQTSCVRYEAYQICRTKRDCEAKRLSFYC